MRTPGRYGKFTFHFVASMTYIQFIPSRGALPDLPGVPERITDTTFCTTGSTRTTKSSIKSVCMICTTVLPKPCCGKVCHTSSTVYSKTTIIIQYIICIYYITEDVLQSLDYLYRSFRPTRILNFATLERTSGFLRVRQ